MTKNILFIVLEKLVKISRMHKIKIVLMGGIATSIFARPRTTYDIDAVISLPEGSLKDFLVALQANGFKFDTKQPIKSIQDLLFIIRYIRPMWIFLLLKTNFNMRF